MDQVEARKRSQESIGSPNSPYEQKKKDQRHSYYYNVKAWEGIDYSTAKFIYPC